MFILKNFRKVAVAKTPNSDVVRTELFLLKVPEEKDANVQVRWNVSIEKNNQSSNYNFKKRFHR